MEKYSINFNELKFNLYEILNIANDAPENKVKKAYRNLILNFHPDKNNSTEEEIYYHIVTAYEILMNKDHRNKYDQFLNKCEDTHVDLKKNFLDINNNKPTFSKEEAKDMFEKKISELNNKHNYNDCEPSGNIKDRYDKILKDREISVVIPKEQIDDIKDFNYKFEDKKTNKSFGDQLIPIHEDMKLMNINDNYTSLDMAFDNLYIDGGGVSTTRYTSLDAAFKIQELDTTVENIDIKTAMNKYKKETDNFKDPNFSFSKTKFDSW
jgi:hypothetical protein